MTPEQLAHLRALASAATPGPWESDLDICDSEEGIVALVFDGEYRLFASLATDVVIKQRGETWTEEDTKRRDEYWRFARSSQELRDAQYIAAANPQAVLALLDRIGELEVYADAIRRAQEVNRDKARIAELEAALREACDGWETAFFSNYGWSVESMRRRHGEHEDVERLRAIADRGEKP